MKTGGAVYLGRFSISLPGLAVIRIVVAASPCMLEAPMHSGPRFAICGHEASHFSNIVTIVPALGLMVGHDFSMGGGVVA